MKIDRSQIDVLNIYRAHKEQINAQRKEAPENKRDKVTLSKEGQELHAAIKDAINEERQKRVEKVKTLIKEGRYKVDSDKLAQKMIEKALQKKKV